MSAEEALAFVGSSIRISHDSHYAEQIRFTEGNRGVVVNVEFDSDNDGTGRIPWFQIQFKNGYRNEYRYDDLIFETSLETNKEAAKLLKKEALT